jgi:hypothetical protein
MTKKKEGFWWLNAAPYNGIQETRQGKMRR